MNHHIPSFGRINFAFFARLALAFTVAYTLPAFTLVQAQATPVASTQLESDLFLDTSEGECLADSDGVLRTRPVTINFDALGGRFSGPTLAGELTGQYVGLNLFPSGPVTVSLTAVVDQVIFNDDSFSSYTWIGHVAGEAGSYVWLTADPQELAGAIYTVEKGYKVSPTGGESSSGPIHCVAEVDPQALMFNEDDAEERYPGGPPQQRGGTAATSTAPALPAEANQPAADDGSLLDILVLYSADAAAEAGGATAIERVAQSFVDRMNHAFANSDLPTRSWLVHAAETEYARLKCSSGERCHATDLDRLTNDGDGFMDEVHILRNTYHADLVLLILRSSSQEDPYSTGGVAWIAAGAGAEQSDESIAFGLGTLGCAEELCLVHEAGHILGLNHDWFVSSAVHPFADGHGHVDPTARFSTILAYGSHCAQLGIRCDWIPYFSNPNIMFRERPTGIAAGTATNCQARQIPPAPCDADASRVLGVTAPFVAQFRSSQIIWTGNKNSEWGDAANWSIAEGPSGGTVEVNRPPRAIDDVLIPAAPAGGNFPLISPASGFGLAVRNLTLQNGAMLAISDNYLDVHGHWVEQGTARTTATGGTVVFRGRLPQTVQLGAGSTLPNLEIGGGNVRVTLHSNVTVNGNVRIAPGATFDGGNNGHLLRVTGNWQDEGNGFVAGSSHVVFNGASQTVDKVTTATLFTEGFSGDNNCSYRLPAGWGSDPQYAVCAGVYFPGRDPQANFIDQDAWLVSPLLDLQPGIHYHLAFTTAAVASDAPLSSEKMTVALGQAPAGTAFTQVLDTFEFTTSAPSDRGIDFTVATAGTYHIGFRAEKPNDNVILLDDIRVTARQNIRFHDLTIAAGATTFNEDLHVGNNLTINPGAVANFGANAVTVEGTVANHGLLQQQKPIAAGGATSLLHIQNEAQAQTKYRGVEITPVGEMGNTLVEVRGNQLACTGVVTDPLMRRCFTITPSLPAVATVKFWYHEAERNRQAANSALVYHHDDGGGLAAVGSNPTRSATTVDCQGEGGHCWVQVEGINDYNKAFGLGSNTPLEVYQLTVTTTGNGRVTSTPAGIDCGAGCTLDANAGTEIRLLPVAGAGSQFAGWAGACSGVGECSVTLDSDKSVTASFGALQPTTYVLTVSKTGPGAGRITSAPGGLDCGALCQSDFNTGVVVVLTAAANAGSTFAGWQGACSGAGACQVTVDAAKSVVAVFNLVAPLAQSITVETVGAGAGTVTSEPAGISCGSICNASFVPGTQVTFAATPDADAVFVGWRGACLGSDPCTVTMDKAHKLQAIFARIDGDEAQNIFLPLVQP